MTARVDRVRPGGRSGRVGRPGSGPGRRVWSVAEVRALGVRTDLVTAGAILGIGRTVAHELARSGSFPVPVVRVGHKYMVPVVPLLELLGVSTDSEPAGEPGPGVRVGSRGVRGHG